MKNRYIIAVAASLILPLLSSNKSGQQVQYSGASNLPQSTQSIPGEHRHFDIDVARTNLINLWQMITFSELEEKRYQKEIREVDSITEIPAGFFDVPRRLEAMSKEMREEMLSGMSPEQKNLLKVTTLEEYKMAYKAMITGKYQQEVRHDMEQPHTYAFYENGTVLNHFKVEDYESNLSCTWGLRADRELWMTHDPSAAAKGYETMALHDTTKFLVLYLDSDSLSLKLTSKTGLEDWEQPRFKTRSSLLGK